MPQSRRTLLCLLALSTAVLLAPATHLFAQAPQPAVGSKISDFTLKTTSDESISLSSLEHKGPVALIILRGYPGYQCPLCMRQVHELEASSDKFAAKGIQLLLVYPGQAAHLDEKANEFVGGTGPLPSNFHLVIDPDFTVVNQYGLRWDKPNETSYPSTFLIDRNGTVLYSKISHTHGDRATTDDILAAAK